MATVYWDNSTGDGLASTAANWTGGAPATGDTVVFGEPYTQSDCNWDIQIHPGDFLLGRYTLNYRYWGTVYLLNNEELDNISDSYSGMLAINGYILTYNGKFFTCGADSSLAGFIIMTYSGTCECTFLYATINAIQMTVTVTGLNFVITLGNYFKRIIINNIGSLAAGARTQYAEIYYSLSCVDTLFLGYNSNSIDINFLILGNNVSLENVNVCYSPKVSYNILGTTYYSLIVTGMNMSGDIIASLSGAVTTVNSTAGLVNIYGDATYRVTLSCGSHDITTTYLYVGTDTLRGGLSGSSAGFNIRTAGRLYFYTKGTFTRGSTEVVCAGSITFLTPSGIVFNNVSCSTSSVYTITLGAYFVYTGTFSPGVCTIVKSTNGTFDGSGGTITTNTEKLQLSGTQSFAINSDGQIYHFYVPSGTITLASDIITLKYLEVAGVLDLNKFEAEVRCLSADPRPIILTGTINNGDIKYNCAYNYSLIGHVKGHIDNLIVSCLGNNITGILTGNTYVNKYLYVYASGGVVLDMKANQLISFGGIKIGYEGEKGTLLSYNGELSYIYILPSINGYISEIGTKSVLELGDGNGIWFEVPLGVSTTFTNYGTATLSDDFGDGGSWIGNEDKGTLYLNNFYGSNSFYGLYSSVMGTVIVNTRIIYDTLENYGTWTKSGKSTKKSLNVYIYIDVGSTLISANQGIRNQRIAGGLRATNVNSIGGY